MWRMQTRLALAILLIAGGVLFLLQNLGVVRQGGDLFWTLAFTAAGGVFLYVFGLNRNQWWALIPALTFLGIAGTIFLGWALPAPASELGGAFFLAALGAAFWVIYLASTDRWWAIIPGGTLVTLALVAGLGTFIGSGFDGGAILFLGLAATFALLYYLPKPAGKLPWALIPAVVFLLLGAALSLAAVSVMRFAWPVVLIGLGLFLVYRAVRRGQAA